MNFFNTKVFRKSFLMYSAIIILSLMSLSIFVTKSIKNTIKNNQLYLNKKIIENVNDYFNNQAISSKNLVNYLYSKPRELHDTINFLNNDYETYIKMRLDKYSNSDEFTYTGINSFVKNCFDYNNNIKNIIFYSYKDDSLRIYEPLEGLRYIYQIKSRLGIDYKNKNFNRYLENILNSINDNNDKNNSRNSSMINNSNITIPDKNSSNKYYYTFCNIKNPNKLEDIGMFIVKYDIKKIDQIVKSYENSKGYVVAINKDGNVIYDSSNKYMDKKYPYIDNISKIKLTDTYVNFDGCNYVNRASNNLGIMVLGVLPTKAITESSKYIVAGIYFLTFLLIIFAEVSTSSRIDNLSRRIQNILLAMTKVQKGDLDTKIVLGKENDEIKLISENFNNMCEKLNEYIKKVYLSEIKQKNAEMEALQSQINPHFLYNTLESIRMKAISDGDKDVGKMLYNLATLFRSMVKGKTFITINEELEHCKLYLELFKFRYEGKLDYCIDVEPELLNKEIIKFSIQPIIENFVVHGIRYDDDDNFILVTLEKELDYIKIYIEDNGIGIPEQKVKEINQSIKNMDNKRKSIGIINVHERIVLTYGNKYGVTVSSKKPSGTIVLIKIPCKEVE